MAGASPPPPVVAAATALRPTFLSQLPGAISNAGRLRSACTNGGSVRAKMADSTLEYRKLGDSDLTVSEITISTVLGEAFIVPVPMSKDTQGRTDIYIGSWLKSLQRDKVIVVTKVCGYSERSSYIRENAKVLQVDAANIKESVEKSLKRLSADYIDLLQIHW